MMHGWRKFGMSLTVVFLLAACRGGGEELPEPTVAPGYVSTSVAESLAAAATYRASGVTATATNTPKPGPSPTEAAPSPTATAVPTATSTEQPRPVIAVVTGDGLRVRTGPGASYAINGMVFRGDELVVSGRTIAGDWLQVTHDADLAGWVFAEFVELSADLELVPLAESSPPTPQPDATPAGA